MVETVGITKYYYIKAAPTLIVEAVKNERLKKIISRLKKNYSLFGNPQSRCFRHL